MNEKKLSWHLNKLLGWWINISYKDKQGQEKAMIA